MDFLESQSQNLTQAYSYKKKLKTRDKDPDYLCLLFNGVVHVISFFIWNSYLILYPILYL